MEEKKHGLSRRGFLKAASVGAAVTVGASSLSLLPGCSPSQTTEGNDKNVGGQTSGSGVSRDINPQEDFSAYTTDYEPLFQTLQIGKLTLKNRFVKSPAGSDTWETPDGDNLTENYLNYYEKFAQDGCAIVFTESAISAYNRVNLADRTHTGWFGGNLDKAEQLMGPVVERIHKHDAYAGCQVGSPAASNIDELTVDDIKWCQQVMVNLAVAYQKAGFDILQLHCSAQQLLNLMMTQRANKRTDEYGADTVENRTRMACETIKMIKEACGQDFPIQILMNAAEENDTQVGRNYGFLTLMDSIENAKMFEAAGADTIYLRQNVPGLHIAQFAPDLFFTGYKCEGINGFGSRFDFSQHFSGALNGQYSGNGLLLKACAEFKKHLSIPVSAAGYMDPRTAPDLIANAVANEDIDYLMMTRPLTVDFEYIQKLKEGRRDEIAPCCRCMHCHNKGGPNGEVGDEWCRVNAMTQNAYPNKNGRIKDGLPGHYELIPAESPKKVLVIGGGPGGMEAARIAALRGHDVTLYEKESSLGGLVKTAYAYKGEHERLNELIAYLARQQEVTGVTVKTDTEVDVDLIDSEKPDSVVVATGGMRTRKFESNDTVEVLGFEEVATKEFGENVCVLGAGAQAIDLALYLLAQGKKVQLVHDGTEPEIDKEQSMWVRTYVLPHLYSQGVRIWSEATPETVEEKGLSITNQFGTTLTLECDTIIECQDMIPNTDLFDSIKDNYEVYAVGDCNAPWNIADAIIYGNLSGRTI